MPKLTQHVKNQITDAIEATDFTGTSFETKLNEDNYAEYFTIIFRDKSSYFFSVEKSPADTEFKVKFCPGSVVEKESSTCSRFSNCLQKISTWTQNIKNEYRATSFVYSEFDAFKSKIEDALNEKFSNPNEMFSEPELEDMKQELENLKKSIKKLKEESEVTAKQLKSITEILNSISTDMTSMPKKTWYRMATFKLFKWYDSLQKTGVGKALIAQGTSKLIEMIQK